MSEPVEQIAPSPVSEPAASEQPKTEPSLSPLSRIPREAWLGAAAVVVVVVLLLATPFWAPPLIALLPWGQPATSQQTAPDPALAQAKAAAATLQQLGQRLATLEARPAPDLSSLQQRVAALEAKPAPDLSAVQQHFAALDKSAADLTQQVAALDKAARQQPAIDPRNTALALVLLQIRDAVEIGRPFDPEYQALVALAREHPEIAAAAAPLAVPAQSGVASRAALAERLRQLAPQIATAKPPPKPSWKSQIVARLRGLVTIRRIDGDDQTPAEAAVGTAERAMASGDVTAAVGALSGLTGANLAAAQPWLNMAKQRLAVETALRQTQAALIAALGAAAPAAVAGQGG